MSTDIAKIKSKNNKIEAVVNHDPNDLEQCTESLSQIELQQFNTKKLFEISLLVETTQCEEKLEEIIQIGKEFEALSFTAFITYQDVLELISQMSSEPEKVDLPSAIKECTQEVAKLAQKQIQKDRNNLQLNILALFVKLKIIHVMYLTRIQEVKKQDRRKQLDTELEALLVVVEKSKAGKGKKDKKGKDKSSKKSSKKEAKTSTKEPAKVLYKQPSDVVLEKDDIVLDDNIYNEIFFYVLAGFNNIIDLCQKLIQINVPISTIVKISCSDSSSVKCQVDEVFDTPSNYKDLENTAVMVFTLFDEKDSKTTLEEFLYVIKKICFFKRQQLCYIRSLNMFNFGATPKKTWTKCFERYNFILDKYPPECINTPIILDALVEQVVWEEKDDASDRTTIIESYTSSDRSSETSSCVCPFGFDTFQSNKEAKCNTKNEAKCNTKSEAKTFQVHEEDLLKIIVNCYQQIGMEIYDATLKNLVLIKPYEWILKYRWSNFDQDLHEDHAFFPEEDQHVEVDRDIDENADFFHLALFSTLNRHVFQFKDYSEIYDWIKDLDYYDENQAFQMAQPYPTPACYCKSELNDVVATNHWKEDLPQAVLLQKLFKSSTDFTRFDQFYCKETDCNLLKFHDNLNDFGADTTIWNQFLRTPICLRDFCKYIVLESHDWFVVHKLREHLGSSLEYLKMTEECAGLTQILNSGVYEEYNYLWKQKRRISGSDNLESNSENRDEILLELIRYPNNNNLLHYCNNTGGNGEIVAYDLGSSQVQLTGSTTVFHSYDGVKITVDSARFLNDPCKCCVQLCSADNTLVFHSSDLTTFHAILADQTIMVFTKEPNKKGNKTSTQGALKSQDKIELKSMESSAEQLEVHRNDETLPFVSGRFIKEVSDMELKVQFGYQNFEKLLRHLKMAMQSKDPIKKVSIRRANSSIKRKNSTIKIPLSGFLTRLLHQPFEKVYKMKGYHPTIHRSLLKTDNPWLSFNKLSITLPNGLSIESLPLNLNLMEVKQSYKYVECGGGEEYRIFCVCGSLLIKKLDGTFKILRSNGDQIHLLDETIKQKKVDRMEQILNILKTLNSYHSTTRPSRGEQLNVKVPTTNYDLNEFGNVPYEKKVILSYDGKEVVESMGKLTERQVYFLVNEDDNLTEEQYFERDDGLKARFTRTGKQEISFPDGTKISKWYEIEEDLIVIDSKCGGWVSVIMTYEHQHPDYVTVLYQGIERKTELYLEDGTILNQTDGNFTINLRNNSKVQVSGTVVTFQKACNECLCTFDARIDTDPCPCIRDCPMGEDEDEGVFLEACDSYNKNLSSDYLGKCTIKPDWIAGEVNKQNCNHFQSCRDRQNLYVLNRLRPNALFWNNTHVAEKQACCTKPDCKLLNYYNEVTNKQTLEFFTNINRDFKKKYTLLSSVQSEVQLSRNWHETKVMFYVAYRILQQIFDVNKFEAISKNLTRSLKKQKNSTSISLIEGIGAVLEYLGELEELSKIPPPEPVVEPTASSVDIFDFFTAKELIKEWRTLRNKYWGLIRRRDFPCYFVSEYYKVAFNGVLKNT